MDEQDYCNLKVTFMLIEVIILTPLKRLHQKKKSATSAMLKQVQNPPLAAADPLLPEQRGER